MSFNPYTMEQIMVFCGFLTMRQAAKVRKAADKNNRLFEEEAVFGGFVTRDQLEIAIREKNKYCLNDYASGSDIINSIRREFAGIV